MNIAPPHLHAASAVRVRGRHGLVRALVLAFTMACASGAVLAGPERDRDGPQNSPQQQSQSDKREQPRGERQAPPQGQARSGERADQHPFDGRMADQQRADEQRRMAQQQQQQQDQGASRHGGRMTPDERRELRRQINDAGIDLYPNTPRR
jgi:hypothetical protein